MQHAPVIARSPCDEATQEPQTAPLKRAQAVIASDQWPATREIGQIIADFEQRHRRRIRFTTTQGWDFLLDLKTATHLRHGDGLVLDDQTIVRVIAQQENLVEITSFDDRTLAVIAWHLGNRHIPVQILRHTMRIRANPVTEDMLERLGATLTPMQEAFDPEQGTPAHG